MIRRLQGQPLTRIRDRYLDILAEIMRDYNIPRRDPGHVIPEDADFTTVVQYADSYYRQREGFGYSRDHYRYDRYWNKLRDSLGTQLRNQLVAHVDIGCGPGIFAWTLLDLARQQRLPYNHIDLYGLDPCGSMIVLAQEIRARLLPEFADYPDLRYAQNVETLLASLTENGRGGGTTYIVTFGHVLVQAQQEDDILNFRNIVAHIANALVAQSHCVLVASDATGRSTEINQGWQLLLQALSEIGVAYNEDRRLAYVARIVPDDRAEGE